MILFSVPFAIIISIAYLIVKIKNGSKDQIVTSNIDGVFAVCTIIDFVIVRYIISDGLSGKLCSDASDFGCSFYYYILVIIILNFLFRALVLAISYKSKLSKFNTRSKIDPILVWFIVLILTIVIPVSIIEFSGSNKDGNNLTNTDDSGVHIVYLDSIDDLPDDDENYIVLDENKITAETVYNNFETYENKDVKLVGYTKTSVVKNNVYQYFLSHHNSLLFGKYKEKFKINSGYNYYVSYSITDSNKDDYILNASTYTVYTIIYGKVSSVDEINEDNNKYYNVNITPSKIYIVRNY